MERQQGSGIWQTWLKTQLPLPSSCETSGKLYVKSSLIFHIYQSEGMTSEDIMHWICQVPCMPYKGHSKNFRPFCHLFGASWGQGSYRVDLCICPRDLHTTNVCRKKKWIICTRHSQQSKHGLRIWWSQRKRNQKSDFQSSSPSWHSLPTFIDAFLASLVLKSS